MAAAASAATPVTPAILGTARPCGLSPHDGRHAKRGRSGSRARCADGAGLGSRRADLDAGPRRSAPALAGYQTWWEAGAQRMLEAVSFIPLFGAPTRCGTSCRSINPLLELCISQLQRFLRRSLVTCAIESFPSEASIVLIVGEIGMQLHTQLLRLNTE
jgi:hypothetical protein